MTTTNTKDARVQQLTERLQTHFTERLECILWRIPSGGEAGAPYWEAYLIHQTILPFLASEQAEREGGISCPGPEILRNNIVDRIRAEVEQIRCRYLLLQSELSLHIWDRVVPGNLEGLAMAQAELRNVVEHLGNKCPGQKPEQIFQSRLISQAEADLAKELGVQDQPDAVEWKSMAKEALDRQLEKEAHELWPAVLIRGDMLRALPGAHTSRKEEIVDHHTRLQAEEERRIIQTYRSGFSPRITAMQWNKKESEVKEILAEDAENSAIRPWHWRQLPGLDCPILTY